MKETGKERFILTKAYEVAYALFRLGEQMKASDFAEQFRASGTALLSAAAAEDYAAAERSLRVMECLVKFGGDVNIIGTPNVDVMTREIYALDAAIAERRTAVKTDEVNVAEIFSKPEVAESVAESAKPEPAREVASQPAKPVRIATAASQSAPEPEPDEDPEPNIIHNESPRSNDSAIRQEAILSLIRESGNCRLKDIQEILPDTSERTIRYDLQTLMEQDLIERIGTAGPSVFYRASVREMMPTFG